MNKKTLELLKAEQEIESEIKESWQHMRELEQELDHFCVLEPEKLKHIKNIQQSIKSLYEHIQYLEKLNETN